MIRYLPFAEEQSHIDIGRYTTHGIEAKDEHGTVLKSVHDVSTNKAFVASLCQRCTAHHLDPIHLRDVVEDSI